MRTYSQQRRKPTDMNSDAALARLADIVPPPEPVALSVGDAAPVSVLAIVIMLAGASLLAWTLRRQRRRLAQDGARASSVAALEQLRTVRAAWTAQRLSERDTAYRLAVILRRGLDLRQLEVTAPPGIDPQTWQDTLNLLDHWRYRAPATRTHAAQQRLPTSLFEQVERWLKAPHEARHV